MEQTLKKYASQDLSSGALSVTTSFGVKWKLNQVLIHASTNITETVTCTHDSGNGANYDTKLDSQDLSAEADW